MIQVQTIIGTLTIRHQPLVLLGPLKPTKNNESSPLFNNWKPANTSKLFYSNSFQGLIKAGAKDLETECTIDNICKC